MARELIPRARLWRGPGITPCVKTRQRCVRQRLTGGPARLVQRPFRHAGQLRLNPLQPRDRNFDEFGEADAPVPYKVGQCGGIKGDVVVG